MNLSIRPTVYLLFPLILLFVLGLMGCSGNEQKRLRYLEATSVAPLQLPAGFKQPQSAETLPLVQPSRKVTATDARPPALTELADQVEATDQ